MKLVIFDCDGTLVDSQHAICAAMEHAFGSLDLRAPSRREVLGVVGLSLPQVFAALAGEQPQSVRDELIRLYRADFPGKREGALAHDPLYTGIGEAVPTLARRDDVVLGIAHRQVAPGRCAHPGARGLARAFPHHPDRRRPSLQAAPLDDPACHDGGRSRPRFHPDGRRHHL
jgi:phosphoglycolate phosphatase